MKSCVFRLILFFSLLAAATPAFNARPYVSAQESAPLQIGAEQPGNAHVDNEIAYLSEAGDVWVAALDGSNARLVIEGPVSEVAWSRDGSMLAYVRQVIPEGSAMLADQIEVAAADGTGQQVVVPWQVSGWLESRGEEGYLEYVEVRWSPDDQSLYYWWRFSTIRGGSGISTIDLATGEIQALTIAFRGMDVASDGTVVFYDKNPGEGDGDLSLLTPGGETVSIREQSIGQGPPTWSPDGTEIALAGDALVVLGRDGAERRVLVGEPVFNVDWPSDGSFLLFDDGLGMIWRVDADGGEPASLFSGQNPALRSSSSAGTTLPAESDSGSPASPADPGVDPEATIELAIELYGGSWAGTFHQSNPSAQWPIALTFRGGPEGTVVGSIEYLPGICKADLIQLHMMLDFGLSLREEVTEGEENCISGGILHLDIAASGLSLEWHHPTSSATGAATLTRSGSADGGTSSGSSIEIHISNCPTGYGGTDFYSVCHDNGESGWTWLILSDTMMEHIGSRIEESPGPGIARIAGLADGTYLVQLLSKTFFYPAYVYCSADAGESVLFSEYLADSDGIHLTLANQAVVCDWYLLN